MLKFPEIDYDYWLDQWYSNININAYHLSAMDKFSKIPSIITERECEEQIRELIKGIADIRNEKECVLKVVDLIYRWGGPSGRFFYISKQNPRLLLQTSPEIFNRYCDAIDLAKNGKASSKFLFQSIPGIGPSFATKHSAFWSTFSPRPLIVVDSKIAGCFGFKKLDEFENRISYEEALDKFSDFAKKKNSGMTVQDIEKALFTFHKHYFKNDNDGWAANVKSTGPDCKIAQELSKELSIL